MSAPEGQEPADPVLAGIRRLQTAFDAKIRYDEVREQLVESMRTELDAHRQDLFHRQLRPILFDLVTMYDDLTKWSDSAACQPATSTVLMFFRDTVEQTLARNGVEVFHVDGDTVDRSRQKVIGLVETTDPAADRQIAERLRPGFSWHDKVLRPEWVNVYVVKESGGTPASGPALPQPDTPQPEKPQPETAQPDTAQPDAIDSTRAVAEEGASN